MIWRPAATGNLSDDNIIIDQCYIKTVADPYLKYGSDSQLGILRYIIKIFYCGTRDLILIKPDKDYPVFSLNCIRYCIIL